jgi:hypothetical protein
MAWSTVLARAEVLPLSAACSASSSAVLALELPTCVQATPKHKAVVKDVAFDPALHYQPHHAEPDHA